MDIAIIVIGSVLLLVGLMGSFLPILPGPPIAYFSLPILLWHSEVGVHPSAQTLLWCGLAVAIVTLIDVFLPVWGTKKFGGTSAGKRGSTIGLLVGLFFPILGPLTIIIAPFFGALIGEMVSGQSSEVAWKSAFGSFLGFLTGTFMKVGVVVFVGWKFVALLV